MNITLETLPAATEQEVFDHIAIHLLTQMEKSMSVYNTMGQYRSDSKLYQNKKLSCAAGCLMGDKEYIPELEGNSWEVLVENDLAPNDHFEIIQKLQRIHDWEDIDSWKQLLINLANKHNLSTKNFNHL